MHEGTDDGALHEPAHGTQKDVAKDRLSPLSAECLPSDPNLLAFGFPVISLLKLNL